MTQCEIGEAYHPRIVSGFFIYMEKKLYFRFSDGIDVEGVIMELSGAMQWIEGDMPEFKEGDDPLPEYVLEPIWLTDEEYNNLQESE